MFLQLLLLIVVVGGIYQYFRSNACGYSCRRLLADGTRAGDDCPCACATCPCSPLEGVYETLQCIPETMYQYCNLALVWVMKQRDSRCRERERYAQVVSSRPFTLATFEIEPSIAEQLGHRQQGSLPDMGRTSTSRTRLAEGGSVGTRRYSSDMFEIEPSVSKQRVHHRQSSWPDVGRTSATQGQTAEGGSDGAPPLRRHTSVSRRLDDEEAKKIVEMCNRCRTKGVTCMGSCPNAKH